MRLLPILWICIASIHCLKVEAQLEIDSLKKILQTTPDGPEKIKLYGNITWAYATTRTHLDSARQYADSIRLLADKLQDEAGTARSHFYYGVIARFQGEYRTALNHLEQYVQYNTFVGESSRVASGLFQIGVVNHDLGNYQKSLSAYYRIIGIHKSLEDHYAIGFTLNSIGVIFKKMNRYDDAIETYNKAITIFDSLGAKADKAGTLTNVANVYSITHQYEKARNYYKQALQINREIGVEDAEAFDLENLGSMLNLLHRYDSALTYHLQALSIRERFPQKEQIATSLKQVGYTYIRLKKYTLAEQYLRRSMEIGTEIQAKLLLRDLHEYFALLYAAQKDYLSAYEHERLHFAFNDSLLNETTTKQLGELQIKYETSEKDKQISLLAKEKEIQQKEAERQSTLKKAFIGGLILITLIAGLTFYILRQRLQNQKIIASKNSELKEVNFKRQLSELEMKALRAQINPHFLFNCMNSINKMILNGETDRASLYLTKFSKLVRLILENAEASKVSLDSELALVESYIQLEELRFKGKIDYNISVDESIEKESTYLPSMVLQPFVENAIWHGLMHKKNDQQGVINIEIKEEEERLHCTIEDNGVGREAAQQLRDKSLIKNKSMGMKITEERLRLLSQEKLEQLIQITDLKDALNHALGTRVEISIPLT